MSYTTQANVEGIIGTLTTVQATYLSDVVLPAIDAYIDRTTNTRFGSTTPTSTYVSGDGSDTLIIPTMHTITAVAIVDNDDVETAVPDFLKYPRGEDDKYALIATSGTWEEGFENYKVSGILGYKNIPDDIIGVATELASNAVKNNTANLKSEKVGDWQVVYDNAERTMSTDAHQVLASYRRLSRSI